MRKVYRHDVKIDDTIQTIGGGKVVMVHSRLDSFSGGPASRVEVWTEESFTGEDPSVTDDVEREVIVKGTGHEIPDGFEHLGSAIDPNPDYLLVWHIYGRVL